MYRKYRYVRISEYSDSDYADDREDRKSTTTYCTFVEGYLVTWRSKKQNVSRLSAEVEYRAIAHTACEMI